MDADASRATEDQVKDPRLVKYQTQLGLGGGTLTKPGWRLEPVRHAQVSPALTFFSHAMLTVYFQQSLNLSAYLSLAPYGCHVHYHPVPSALPGTFGVLILPLIFRSCTSV